MDLKIHFLNLSKMEIFVFNKTNIDFLNPTLDSCLSRIQSAPYWIVLNRICYHLHDHPDYILYRNRPIPYEYAYLFDSFLHVNVSKPLYSISTYTHAQLCTMAAALQISTGTKSFMYAKIKDEIAQNEEVVKKLIRHLTATG